MSIIKSRILENFSPEVLTAFEKIYKKNNLKSYSSKGKLYMEVLDEYNIEYNHLGSGTNRMAVLIDGYVFKFAYDKNGRRDNLLEFSMSEELLPYVTKTYETNGLICVAEYVTSFQKDDFVKRKEETKEILSILAESYLLGDVGSIDKNYVNWGYRDNGEICILDFAFVYRVIGDEMKCRGISKEGKVCESFLNYDQNYSKLVCPSCGKSYSFLDIRRRINLEYEKEEITTSKRNAYKLVTPRLTVKSREEIFGADEDDHINHQAKKRKYSNNGYGYIFDLYDERMWLEDMNMNYEPNKEETEISEEEFWEKFEEAQKRMREKNADDPDHLERIKRRYELEENQPELSENYYDEYDEDYEPQNIFEAKIMRYQSKDPIADYLGLRDYDDEEDEYDDEDEEEVDLIAEYLGLPDYDDDYDFYHEEHSHEEVINSEPILCNDFSADSGIGESQYENEDEEFMMDPDDLNFIENDFDNDSAENEIVKVGECADEEEGSAIKLSISDHGHELGGDTKDDDDYEAQIETEIIIKDIPEEQEEEILNIPQEEPEESSVETVVAEETAIEEATTHVEKQISEEPEILEEEVTDTSLVNDENARAEEVVEENNEKVSDDVLVIGGEDNCEDLVRLPINPVDEVLEEEVEATPDNENNTEEISMTIIMNNEPEKEETVVISSDEPINTTIILTDDEETRKMLKAELNGQESYEPEFEDEDDYDEEYDEMLEEIENEKINRKYNSNKGKLY